MQNDSTSVQQAMNEVFLRQEEALKKFSRTINIKEFMTKKPDELDYLWPGGPLRGTVGALVAPGATGKSFFALQLAAAIASKSKDADLMGLGIEKFGKVVYFSLEDPECILHHRLYDLAKNFTEEMINNIDENLLVIALDGEFIDIMNREIDRETKKEDEATDFMMMRYAIADTRLCIFDTFSRIHAEEENSNKDMSRVIRRLESIAVEEKSTVLYLHHVSKAAAKENADAQSAGRGASALVDNPRWCGNLVKMTAEMSKDYFDIERGAITEDDAWLYVGFNSSKQNYGSVNSIKKWFRRNKDGILIACDIENVTKTDRKKASENANSFNMTMKPTRETAQRKKV